MKVSLDNFAHFQGSKTIVIGDMLELGEDSYNEHLEIVYYAKTLNFDEIITVGKNFSEVKQNVANFLTTEDLINYLKEHQIKSQNILLKASRGIALEKALDFIQ